VPDRTSSHTNKNRNSRKEISGKRSTGNGRKKLTAGTGVDVTIDRQSKTKKKRGRRREIPKKQKAAVKGGTTKKGKVRGRVGLGS